MGTFSLVVSVGAQARLGGMVVCHATLGRCLMIESGEATQWIVDFMFVMVRLIWFMFFVFLFMCDQS